MVRSTSVTSAANRTPAEDPAVMRFVAKQNELSAEENTLDRQLAEIHLGLAQSKSTTSDEAAARELLADGIGSLDVADLQQQASIVAHKLRILRKAAELNRRELDQTRSKVSQAIAAERRPAYAGIVATMHERVLAMQAAMADEAAFRHQAEADDVQLAAATRIMSLPASLFEGWLAEAREYYSL